MLLLGKLLDLRNQGDNAEGEKPFLEHLDDLRVTIIRLIVTVVLGFSICFVFRNDLMEIMRKPIDGVWQLQLDTALHKLPVKINANTWERATKASNEGRHLDEEQRSHFLKYLDNGDPDFLFHVRSVDYWRSALAIEQDKERRTFIEGLPQIDEQMRAQLLAMQEYYKESKKAGPNPDAELRKRTVFMQSLHPTEGFMLSFKLALYAGLAVTFPFILYFVLQFVLPGLHQKEKKALFPALAIGFGLFLTGVLFSYFIVLPRVLEFFTTYSAQMGVLNDWRIGEYISFTTQFVLIFGLAFELPVVVMTLVFLDILEYRMMAKSRSYAIIAVIVTAAVITPTPDAMTLLLLAGPMYMLYEICIWMAWFIGRKKRKEEEAEAAAEKERIEKLIAQVKKDEEELHKSLGVVAAPAGLISHGEDEFPYSDHDHHSEHEHYYDEAEHSEEDNDLTEEVDIASLEGNGEALDPEAEAREADREEDEKK